jgi:DNA-binding transcriptional regulator GbsR (MarR family)
LDIDAIQKYIQLSQSIVSFGTHKLLVVPKTKIKGTKPPIFDSMKRHLKNNPIKTQIPNFPISTSKILKNQTISPNRNI